MWNGDSRFVKCIMGNGEIVTQKRVGTWWREVERDLENCA